MDKRDLANRLVKDLGATLTVPDMELDERSHCVLLFDENIVLNMEYDAAGERMLLYVYLDELPRENAEPILREALAGNLFWHRTKGATLSLEEGTGGIVLIYPHSLDDLDAAKFETVVENFVQTAENWKKRIAALKEDAGTKGKEPPDSLPVRPGEPMIYA